MSKVVLLVMTAEPLTVRLFVPLRVVGAESVRLRERETLLSVAEPLATFVVPVPVIVPPCQSKKEVVVRLLLPVSVPDESVTLGAERFVFTFSVPPVIR